MLRLVVHRIAVVIVFDVFGGHFILGGAFAWCAGLLDVGHAFGDEFVWGVGGILFDCLFIVGKNIEGFNSVWISVVGWYWCILCNREADHCCC